MAGIDAPYRDPREELARAMQRAMRPPPAAPLPSAAPIPVGEVTEFRQPSLERTPAQQPGRSPEFREAQRSIGAMPKQAAQAAKPVVTPSAAQGIGAVPAPSATPPQTGPVASARAAASKAIGSASSIATPSPVLAATGAVSGTVDAMNTPTENYYRRLQLDPAGAGQNGFKDVAVRSIGALSDVGAGILDIPMSVVNGVRKFAGAEALPTFREILTAGDGAVQTAAAPVASAAVQPKGSDMPAPPQFNDRRSDGAGGVVRYDPATKTYSGTDVKEGASITGGLPGQRGTGRGNVTTLDTSEGFAQDLKQLASLRAERAERESGFAVNQLGGGLAGIRDSRREAADARTDMRGGISNLMRVGLSAQQAAATLDRQAGTDSQRDIADLNAALTARGQDIGAAGQAQAQRGQQATARMQDQTTRDIAALNASRPSANQQPRFTAVNLPDTVDASGQIVRGGQAVLNNQTGQWEYPNGGRQQQQFSKGQVYTDAKGNRATWDGEKFVPAK